MINGYDFSKVDKDKWDEKIKQYKLAIEARSSVNETFKNIKSEAAEILGIKSKTDTKKFIDMYIKLDEEGEIEDEEKVEAIKELFLKDKGDNENE